MTPLLGKRKRRASLPEEAADNTQAASSVRLQALLQSHFEKTFTPLQTQEPRSSSPSDDSTPASPHSSVSDSSWSGLSADDDAAPVQVVEHASKTAVGDLARDGPSKTELRAFMVRTCYAQRIEAGPAG